MFNSTPVNSEAMEGTLVAYNLRENRYLYLIHTFSSGGKRAICGHDEVKTELNVYEIDEDECFEHVIETIDSLQFAFFEF